LNIPVMHQAKLGFFRRYLKNRRLIISAAVVIVVFSIFAYGQSRKEEPFNFVAAARGDLSLEVNVTGRVEPAQSVELGFEKGGRVTGVPAEVGQSVRAGEILISLDATDAVTKVREAELALSQAAVVLDKLRSKTVDQLTLVRLKKASEDGLAIAARVYSNLFTIIDALDPILFGQTLSGNVQKNNIEYYISIISYYDPSFFGLSEELKQQYHSARDSYEPAFALYKAAARGGELAAEETIFAAYNLVEKVTNVIKSGRDAVQFFKDQSIINHWTSIKSETVDQHLSDLSKYYDTLDGYLRDLLTVVNVIKNERNALAADKLDIRSQELAVEEKENVLRRAEKELADSYLRAPFNGVVTRQDAKAGEIVTANTPLLFLISTAQFEIKANVPEADIAKVKVGDSADVTLDAYGSEEVFQAKVTVIDPAETLIEGVATYRVTFQFSVASDKIKSGMTANIDIQSASRQGVIIIPQRAVVKKNGQTFVQVLDGGEVKEVQVKTGLRGSDGNIEIVEGVKEGDAVVISSKK